jgi:hypothetical protein
MTYLFRESESQKGTFYFMQQSRMSPFDSECPLVRGPDGLKYIARVAAL